MVGQRNIFVFVVCGGKKYIDALNLAVEFLKTRTKSGIAVITDLNRNEVPVLCDQVIDVRTPEEMNHHQASVFLKTSLHRYLDMDRGRYCYLDSDVLALSDRVDEIFSEQTGIIGFCADNMTLDLFSPYAVNCGCLEQSRLDGQKLAEAQQAYQDLHQEWEEFIKKQKGDVLDRLIRETASNQVQNAFALSRFYVQKVLPFYGSAAFKGYTFDKQLKAWRDSAQQVVLFPIPDYYDFVGKKTGWVYDKSRGYWRGDQRKDVCVPQCTHLHQQIKKDYGLSISPAQWQHWNGGVFLFDKRSVEFLEYWHERTMEIFKQPAWKTRDQGTLALAAWKFGLQKQKCLEARFNYIVDYYKPGLGYDPVKGFTRDGGLSHQRPELMHVYHRFGDVSWDFWQALMNRGDKKGAEIHE